MQANATPKTRYQPTPQEQPNAREALAERVEKLSRVASSSHPQEAARALSRPIGDGRSTTSGVWATTITAAFQAYAGKRKRANIMGRSDRDYEKMRRLPGKQ